MTLTPDSISTVEHRENAQEIYAEMIPRGKAIRFHVEWGANVDVLTTKYVGHEEINLTKKVLQKWNKLELKPEGITCHDPKSEERQKILRGICHCEGGVNPTTQARTREAHEIRRDSTNGCTKDEP